MISYITRAITPVSLFDVLRQHTHCTGSGSVYVIIPRYQIAAPSASTINRHRHHLSSVLRVGHLVVCYNLRHSRRCYHMTGGVHY